jgi:drug/metabolite transporter (DMT)-like permease
VEIVLWIPITIAAAFAQNIRSALQKQLTGRLSINGASYVRFCYALPFVWLYLVALAATRDVPAPGPAFWGYCLAGAVGQIVATSALVASFTFRNFAVGTGFSKTEVVLAAMFGLLVLGEPVSWQVSLGIVVSLVGVWLLSVKVRLREFLPGFGRSDAVGGGFGPALGLGVVSGACFAVAFVCYRGASLSLPEGDYLIRASTTLVAAVSMQCVLMAAYLRWREPGELARVAAAWQPGVAVGAAGALASIGWFTAATLETAALVRGLGQVELIFAFAASVWFFKETVTARELAGVALIIVGVWVLI